MDVSLTHGRGVAPDQAQAAPQARGQNGPQNGPKTAEAKTGGSDPAVTVTLSLTAEELLSAEGEDSGEPQELEYTGPGKSVAHRARQLLGSEQFAALGDLPFGKVVSALARGEDLTSLLPSAPEEDGAALTEPASAEDIATTDEAALTGTGGDEPVSDPLAPSAPETSEEDVALSLLQQGTETGQETA